MVWNKGCQADVVRGVKFENGLQLDSNFAYIGSYSRKYVWKILKRQSKLVISSFYWLKIPGSNISQHICPFIVAVGRHFGLLERAS